MAYLRRRRVFRKRRPKRKVSYPIKRYVRAALRKNIEMKFRQYQWDAVGREPISNGIPGFGSVSYGGSSIFTSLDGGIDNGTGEGQRIGNRITIKGFQINMAVQTGDYTNYFRMLLVSPKKQYDKSSAANFIQELFSNKASNSYQWLQPVDTEVYKVYWDKKVDFRYLATGGTGGVTDPAAVPGTKFFKKFVKLNKKCQWTVANGYFSTSPLFLVAISDSGAVTNPGAVAGFVKVWYTDA